MFFEQKSSISISCVSSAHLVLSELRHDDVVEERLAGGVFEQLGLTGERLPLEVRGEDGRVVEVGFGVEVEQLFVAVRGELGLAPADHVEPELDRVLLGELFVRCVSGKHLS